MKRLLLFIPVLLAAGSASAQLSFTTLNTTSTANLLCVHFNDTLTGYACGEGGAILKTVNGGASWSALSSGTTSDLWDIKVLPQSGGQKVVAVGANNTVIKSVNGGSSWTAQSIPFAPSSFVFGLCCLDSLTYFACGGDFTTNSGAVLKTVNGGQTWTKTSLTSSLFLDKIFMLNTTTGFSVGTNSSFTDGSIQKTTTGTAWSAVKTSPDLITNVWCQSASDVIAVGLGGQIWKSTDGGGSWSSKSVNTTDLLGVAFRDAQHGYACGGGAAGCMILSTANGGASWTQESYSFGGTFFSACVAGNKLFIAGDGGRIIKATLSSGTGLAQRGAAAGISVYPNPATDRIHVANPQGLQGLQFQLTGVNGSVAAEALIPVEGLELAAAGLAKGVYGYVVRREGAVVAEGKVVLQ